jgi:colanic acid biosynthesis glycosyl transferase WcaI
MSRIVFVNRYFHPDESATAQFLADLAFGLAAREFDVHVVCSRQLYGDPEARLAALQTVRGVVVHRVWTTRFGRRRLLGRAIDYASFYITCAVVLLGLLKPRDIVVAKTDPPLISMLAAPAARLKGALLINWLQDIFPEVASQLGANPLPAALDRALRSLRDASLRRAAVNVVLGSRMLEYLGARGVPASKCRVIENWADAETVHPKESGASELRNRLGLADKFVVGYSGNLGRAHEFETVIGAAERLRADQRIAFLFIGGGARMDELKASAEQRGLSSFHFLPYRPREELEDSLAAADVHLVSLVPSLEGLIVPSKFYGILAAGRPTLFVGDRDGELSRVIAKYQCGLVVAVGRSDELAAAIDGLQRDPNLRRAMGSAARELLCSNFSAQRAIGCWISLLDEVGAA